jgi:hypothetical protein
MAPSTKLRREELGRLVRMKTITTSFFASKSICRDKYGFLDFARAVDSIYVRIPRAGWAVYAKLL